MKKQPNKESTTVEKEHSSSEYTKPELVYAVALMLSCHDMESQINKLSMPCLYRIFDQYSLMGNNFANLEDSVRYLERQNLELQTKLEMSERKVAAMESKRRGRR
jgi:enoyl-[acyl-carrier-protein] reductase (NADH)